VATSTIAAELEEFASAENICDTIAYDTFETDPLQTPLIWYLALRAVDGFYSNYARFPGSNDDALEHDQKEVFNEMLKLARKLNIPEHLIESSSAANSPSEGDPSEKMETESSSQPALITKNHAIEITRYGGCELHNICSVIGGIASQEAVKIITNQYEPFDNTYVFNGVATCGAVYTL
jgi:amyloid beta precursor protein binding protein 1